MRVIGSWLTSTLIGKAALEQMRTRLEALETSVKELEAELAWWRGPVQGPEEADVPWANW